jgi:phosphoglycolate phosphatase
MIILFDLDGTLIDSTEAILESFHNSFNHFGVAHPSDESITKLIGYPLDIMYSELGIEDSLVWSYVDVYKLHYRKISTQKTILLPFAKESVVKASKFARLGIVTTKTALYSRELMENFGLMDYFEILIGREDVKNPKPHEEPILKAIEALEMISATKVLKSECWIIGDTLLDIDSAKAAKIGAIGVTSGYGTKNILEKNCDIVCENSLKAVEILQKVT